MKGLHAFLSLEEWCFVCVLILTIGLFKLLMLTMSQA
jgi:uncharacterized membrane protein